MRDVRESSHEVRVAGRLVRYRGAGEGEPVILVHGLSGSSRWWARNLPALAQRHRVYLVDLPGFGAMPGLHPRFVLAEAASWLLAWMAAVEPDRAHVAGHSMGGYICIRLAAQYPHAVRRLVLVAPAGVPTRRSVLAHLIPLLMQARHVRPAFLPVMACDALRAGPLTLGRAARDLLAGDIRADLRSIVAPTLLVWGENDSLIPPSTGHILRLEIADSRLLILRGTGHVPMVERPNEFHGALLSFLRGEPVGE